MHAHTLKALDWIYAQSTSVISMAAGVLVDLLEDEHSRVRAAALRAAAAMAARQPALRATVAEL